MHHKDLLWNKWPNLNYVLHKKSLGKENLHFVQVYGHGLSNGLGWIQTTCNYVDDFLEILYPEPLAKN
mgnify:CR=1 FL=1